MNNGETQTLQQLIGEIETLRHKRREEWRHRQHPQQKRFTQEEICEGPCPTYRNLLMGRSHRLPNRATVLAIAAYLECSITETNDLLTAACYLSEIALLSDNQYRLAAANARMIAHALPLPTLVLGRYGEILDANPSTLLANGLPPPSLWQPEQYNFIGWMFDKSLPTYQQYFVSSGLWETTARGGAQILYLSNKSLFNEPGFQQRLEKYRQLPGFDPIWQATCAAPPLINDVYGEHHFQPSKLDEPTLERTLLIPMSEHSEVSLVVGIPLNEVAYAFYTSLGCDLNHMRWEALLTEYNKFTKFMKIS